MKIMEMKTDKYVCSLKFDMHPDINDGDFLAIRKTDEVMLPHTGNNISLAGGPDKC